MAVWNPRANEIFADLLEMPPEQRHAALERACGTDREVRRQVEAMLTAHAEAGSFLDQPALGAAPPGLLAPTRTALDASPPRSIGGSVMQALAEGLAEIPRVHLREPEGEAYTPVSRPGTENMPAGQRSSDWLQLHGEIARGGMGAILKGRDTDLGRDIAVKVLLEAHQGKAELVQRFIEEAQIAGQLQHPGVAPVYGLGQFSDGRPYFTMKLVKGKTLAALLAARKEPGEERSKFLGIFAQVCQTLAYAHARGVIHRDLKPANVMVGAFGEVQVMDWGLAKVLAEGGVADEQKAHLQHTVSLIRTQRSQGSSAPEGFGSHTLAGSMLGTPAYMSPEQARGDVDLIDQRADVFGLGAILCELLTGQPPYTGKKADVLRKAQTASLDEVFGRLDGCGADVELVSLTRRCLAPQPWDRLPDAGHVAGAVTTYQNSVAERLHQAELARAAEAARAEESRATAAAAEARARAERRARGLTAALAGSVLLAAALGVAGWRWVELERMGRAAALDARVNAALQEAVRLRGLAQGAPPGNLAPWTEAVAAAKHAETLLEPEVNPALRQQAETLLAEVAAEERQAAAAVQAAKRDDVLLERLIDIRSAKTDDHGGWETDAAYAEAFRDAGIDVAAPAEVGAALRTRPAATRVALAAALDDWAAVRRDTRRDRAGAHRLTEAAQVVDPDPGRGKLRAALEEPDREARLAALRALAKSERLDEMGAVSLDLLGNGLSRAGDAAAAETVLRAAQRRHPGDVWVNHDLGSVLGKRGRYQESIRYFMAARALRPETAKNLAGYLQAAGETNEAILVLQDLVGLRPKNLYSPVVLGGMLLIQGRAQEGRKVLDAAVAALREAIRLRPDDATAHAYLGLALRHQRKLDEAAAALRKAVELAPDYAWAHERLGIALGEQGRLDESISAFRKATDLEPDYANAYGNLGASLAGQGKFDEALAACREAFQLAPGLVFVHANVGEILAKVKHDYEAAAAANRKAIELRPDHFIAHNNLGECLALQGKLDEAIAAFRTSILLNPDNEYGYCNLGYCLRRKGEYDEALARFRRVQEVGRTLADSTLQGRVWKASLQRAPGHDSRKPLPLQWMREVEQMIVLAPRLSALVQDHARPADAAERFTLAQMCADREWYAAAAGFWSQAFAADPERANDLETELHFHAARAAALAAAGKTRDTPPSDPAARAHLRQQARAWLQADLEAYAQCLKSNDRQTPALVRQRLAPWKYDPQLAGLRDEAALKDLPAAEREACRKLWDQVQVVLQNAQEKPK
jgi:serine/threonine-protein kinase